MEASGSMKTGIQVETICDLFKNDEFNLNVIHYNILARDADGIEILLKKFKKIEYDIETKIALPYLHLAAIVGCSKIATLLCRFHLHVLLC